MAAARLSAAFLVLPVRKWPQLCSVQEDTGMQLRQAGICLRLCGGLVQVPIMLR